MKTEELKPCPLGGAEPTLSMNPHTPYGLYELSCNRCGLTLTYPLKIPGSKQTIIKRWNTRHEK